jgi:hypothetical protein
MIRWHRACFEKKEEEEEERKAEGKNGAKRGG